jgi:hypothetical protein
MTLVRGFLVVAILAITVGCLRRGRKDATRPFDAITTVRITNENWLDVRVYVAPSGSSGAGSHILGIAKSFASEVFQMPRDVMQTGSVQLTVDPIGSQQRYRTESISVLPGQQIHLVVAQRLQQSYYSVADR